MPISRRGAALTAVVLLASVAGCDRARSRDATVDVYVAGWELDGNARIGKVWKNGVAQALSQAPDESIATAVAVGGDGAVYVVGCASGGRATAWRDGVPQTLSDGLTDACAEDVAVSGSDVYVAGHDDHAPVVWKNGVKEVLPHPSTGSANAVAIAVAGGDVYVAGWAFKTTLIDPNTLYSTTVAMLWKNGVALELSDGLSPADARGVAVDGADVYVVGSMSSDNMTIWKNGVASSLGDGRPALATEVVATGGHVFVAGGVNGGRADMVAVWRDGVVSTYTTGAYQSFAEGLAVSDAGVYAVGYAGGVAMLWDDGAPVPLTDGSNDADALDVAVVVR